MQIRKIKATSLAEITISLVIISICLGIASQFFVRVDQSLKTSGQIKDEMEVQNWMLVNYHLDTMVKSKSLSLKTGKLETEKERTPAFHQFKFVLKDGQRTLLQYQSFKSVNYHEN